jgi:uncharacterized protein (DUF2237 family)
VKYFIVDNKGNETDYGEGRALNLSKNGTLLETVKSLNGAAVIRMTIDLNGKDVNVSGRLVSSNMQNIAGYYFSGIDFIGPEDQQLTALIEEYQKYSGTKERRRSPRIETSSFVDYIVFDNKGKATDRGKGRAVNLSQNGIRLETGKPLNDVFVMLNPIDIDSKDVKLKGRIIYSNMENTTGHYFSGICFGGLKDQQVGAIVAFVKSFYRSKTKGKIPGLLRR